MLDSSALIEKLTAQLDHARHMLAHATRLPSEEWLLVATIVGEADLTIRAAQEVDPAFRLPLFEAVLEDLRQETDGFRDQKFLASTRAARRRNPRLFEVSKRLG